MSFKLNCYLPSIITLLAMLQMLLLIFLELSFIHRGILSQKEVFFATIFIVWAFHDLCIKGVK